MSFQGVGGGTVTLDDTGTRIVQVYMFALNTSLLPYLAASLVINGSEVVIVDFLIRF